MQLSVTITEEDLRKLVVSLIAAKTGQEVDPAKVCIEVKSTCNWKAEWEKAHFRATFNADV
jgi:hypothetical protein